MDERRDREFGMYRRITRRDFLDGVRLAVGPTGPPSTQAPDQFGLLTLWPDFGSARKLSSSAVRKQKYGGEL
jgi:hypothetical protein